MYLLTCEITLESFNPWGGAAASLSAAGEAASPPVERIGAPRLMKGETMNRRIKTGLLAMCLLSGVAMAEDDHPHHASLFLGNTNNDKDQNAFTVGLEYEYRVSSPVGLGALIDYAGGSIETTIIAAGPVFHFWRELKVIAMPGVDLHDGHEEFVTRVGALYDFHVGAWSISPTLHVDVLELKENIIFGLGFGHGW